MKKWKYKGKPDPRMQATPYVEQFVEGSWRDILTVTGWRPSRAVVVHRSKLDAEAIRWLAEFNRLNGRK